MDALPLRLGQKIGLTALFVAVFTVSTQTEANTIAMTAAFKAQQQVDLTLQKTGPVGSTVTAGDTIVYQLFSTNEGPDTAYDVTVTDYVPNGLTFNAAQSSSECVLNGAQVHCHMPTMNANTNKTYTVAFNVSANPNFCNKDIVNSASISTSSTETNPVDNQAQNVRHTIDCNSMVSDVRIQKSGPTEVPQRNTIVYTLRVTNDGPQPAMSVTADDAIPNGLEFVPAQSSNECVVINNNVICGQLPSLAPGTSKEYTVAFKTKDPNTCNVEVQNQATVSVETTDPQPANNISNITRTNIRCAGEEADLRITKTGPAQVVRDNTILYTLQVLNSGPNAAQNTSVVDAIPAGLTFVANQSNSTCQQMGNDVVCFNSNPLQPNAARSVEIAFAVSANATCGSTVVNQASVSSTTQDPNIANNQSQSVSTTVTCPNPTFAITKTDGRNTAAPEDVLTYNIAVTNTSTVDASNVTVTDVLPSALLFLTASDNGSHTNGTVTWNNISIAAGQTKTLTLEAKVLPNTPNQTVLTNTATVNNGPTATDSTTITVNAQPTFTIAKTDGLSLAGPGDTLSYTIVVTNTSSVTATSVSVVDTLPSNVTVTSIGQGGVELSNGTVHWNNLNFSAGESKTLTLEVLVNPNITQTVVLTNIAAVIDGPSATDTTTVQNVQAKLRITKTDNKTVTRPSEISEYVITVKNIGTTSVRDFFVEDQLPHQLEFIQFVSHSMGAVITTNDGLISWYNITLQPNEEAILVFTANARSNLTNGTVITNTATINNGLSATDTTTVQVSQPVLTIRKTDNRTTAKVGDTLNYVITVSNTSNTNATNVEIIDTVPSQLQILNATTPSTINGQTVTWSNVNINANSQITFTINAQVRSGTANSTVLLNTAQIVGGNSATDTTTVEGNNGNSNNVTIDITDLRDPVRPRETYCYSIRVTNLNSNNLSNLTVTQSLDSQTDFVSASGGGSHSSRTITWRNIDLNGNGTRTLGSCVRVDSNAEDDDLLRSSAFVANASDNETTRVEDDDNNDDRCRIRSISDNPDPVRAGETLEYDIRIENESSSDREFDIRAFLDNRVSFLSASRGGDDVGTREVEWENFDVDENETETLRLTVRVRNNVSSGDTIRIQVHCEDDSETESTRVEGGTTPEGEATLSIDKSANRHEAKPGDTVIYTVTVRNLSNRAANNVSVQDRFTSGSISIEDAGGGNVTGNGIHWTIPVLQANGSRSFSYRVRVGREMRHGQIIANTVRASSPSVTRDATDIEEVRVITDLPQTGLGSFFNAWQQDNSHLSPSNTTATEPSTTTATTATSVWATLMSVGLVAGGAIGRRFWL